MNNPPLDELIQNYLDWLKNVKAAPYHTFRAYQVDLIQFLKYFLRIDKNDIPSKEEMEEYIATVKNKYNYASYRRKITVLRNLTKYLVDTGINVPDPFISISLPMPNINFNLPIAYEEVLSFIDSLPENDLLKIRAKLIFSLIGKSGLTIKQLLSLKIKNINLANGQIILTKNQLTFLDDKTKKLIEKYLSRVNEICNVSLEDFLITNWDKKVKGTQLPLSTRTINLVVDKTARERNFHSRLSPTILRRLFAKSLSENNINQTTKELIFGKKCRLVG